ATDEITPTVESLIPKPEAKPEATVNGDPPAEVTECPIPTNQHMIFISTNGCKGFFIDPDVVTKREFAVFRNTYEPDDQWWTDESSIWRAKLKKIGGFPPIDESS